MSTFEGKHQRLSTKAKLLWLQQNDSQQKDHAANTRTIPSSGWCIWIFLRLTSSGEVEASAWPFFAYHFLSRCPPYNHTIFRMSLASLPTELLYMICDYLNAGEIACVAQQSSQLALTLSRKAFSQAIQEDNEARMPFWVMKAAKAASITGNTKVFDAMVELSKVLPTVFDGLEHQGLWRSVNSEDRDYFQRGISALVRPVAGGAVEIFRRRHRNILDYLVDKLDDSEIVIGMIRKLLYHGVEQILCFNITPLAIAADRGHARVLYTLLVNFGLQQDIYHTALSFATARNQEGCVRLLLYVLPPPPFLGSVLNAVFRIAIRPLSPPWAVLKRDNPCYNYLSLSVANSNVGMLRTFMGRGSFSPGVIEEAVCLAMYKKDLECVKVLLSGLNNRVTSRILMAALVHGDHKLVQDLLSLIPGHLSQQILPALSSAKDEAMFRHLLEAVDDEYWFPPSPDLTILDYLYRLPSAGTIHLHGGHCIRPPRLANVRIYARIVLDVLLPWRRKPKPHRLLRYETLHNVIVYGHHDILRSILLHDPELVQMSNRVARKDSLVSMLFARCKVSSSDYLKIFDTLVELGVDIRRHYLIPKSLLWHACALSFPTPPSAPIESQRSVCTKLALHLLAMGESDLIYNGISCTELAVSNNLYEVVDSLLMKNPKLYKRMPKSVGLKPAALAIALMKKDYELARLIAHHCPRLINRRDFFLSKNEGLIDVTPLHYLVLLALYCLNSALYPSHVGQFRCLGFITTGRKFSLKEICACPYSARILAVEPIRLLREWVCNYKGAPWVLDINGRTPLYYISQYDWVDYEYLLKAKPSRTRKLARLEMRYMCRAKLRTNDPDQYVNTQEEKEALGLVDDGTGCSCAQLVKLSLARSMKDCQPSPEAVANALIEWGAFKEDPCMSLIAW